MLEARCKFSCFSRRCHRRPYGVVEPWSCPGYAPGLGGASQAECTRLIGVFLSPHAGARSGLGVECAQRYRASSFCTRISSASLGALFTAKVSKPFFTMPYPGNGRCDYGVGPSADLSGTALEFAKSGAVIDLISFGANAQYASNAKHISGNVYVPLEHIVWRAFFVYLPSFPQAPAVYAQQGGLFCSVDLNIDNSNEVGLPSSSPARVAPGMEAELAKKEGAFCTDVFGHA